MSFIPKPVARHPGMLPNKIGLTLRDYEGSMSTLCAGCGHDSISAAIIQAYYELDMPPHRVAKLSGIGCSSKTPTYFLGGAHGFNSAHGRMAAIATGANAANRAINYIGVSGDGDSLSIGLGHLCHAIRRNLDIMYVLENNGVYGLTKGQFSAATDVGSKSKKGEANVMSPIDPIILALSLGIGFVARSFSGDKKQLVPILKAAIKYKGFALIDIISPCVTFNDHEGSTKSYRHTRKNQLPVLQSDFVAAGDQEITADYEPGATKQVKLHDGGEVVFRKVPEDYDPHSREKVVDYIESHTRNGEILTGLLYLDESKPDMHGVAGTVDEPLNAVPYEKLCPGSAVLKKMQAGLR